MKTTGKTAHDQHTAWMANPDYVKAYQDLAEECDLVSELIKARIHAGLSQSDVAERMNTSQSVIARLESGAHNASLKTLQRYAQATGTHLKISFETL
jgi:ribosome-binding protein aMBF1 (putative translation factor)